MLNYIIRRILYGIPILIGVNIIVFFLFFGVNSPDDMARLHLGGKRVTYDLIENWKKERSLDLPLFYNNGYTSFFVKSAIAEKNNFKIPFTHPGKYQLLIINEATSEIQVKKEMSKNSLVMEILNMDKVKENLIFEKKSHENGRLELSMEKKHISLFFEIKAPVTLEISLQSPIISTNIRLMSNFKKDLSFLEHFTETIFFQKSLKMLFFDFGKSDRGKDISYEVTSRILPSLSVTIPIFFLSIFINVFVAMILAYYRGSLLDTWGVILCVLGMSISSIIFIILGQVVFGKWFKWFPISGFGEGLFSLKFVILPVIVALISSFGSEVRFYRTLFLEEMNKDYIKTARAKGLKESRVLFVHLLKNAMIPILTGVVVNLPFLFIGSLILESFFGIPGMGSYLIEAISQQDFAVVQAMVSLGSFLYIMGLILTDISYTLVDPRVVLK